MKTKFCIYTNDYKNSIALKTKLTKELVSLGYEISDNATNIIVIGGDGTFVHAFNKYSSRKVKMILINTGFVGFYALNNKLDVKELVKLFANSKNFVSPDVVVFENDNQKFVALNEITLAGVNTMSCDIAINGCHYQMYRGSGLCFSTKTGSTGYNKSLGGSILLTKEKIWEMTEISPIAHAKYLSIRNSIVLDKNKVITLKNLRSNGSLVLLNDGFEHQIDLNLPVKVYLSKPQAQISFCNDLNAYLNKLQKVFIIGDKK